MASTITNGHKEIYFGLFQTQGLGLHGESENQCGETKILPLYIHPDRGGKWVKHEIKTKEKPFLESMHSHEASPGEHEHHQPRIKRQYHAKRITNMYRTHEP